MVVAASKRRLSLPKTLFSLDANELDEGCVTVGRYPENGSAYLLLRLTSSSSVDALSCQDAMCFGLKHDMLVCLG